MAKNWYPVINYSECIECGACVKKCTHGTYDKAKAPTPVVINTMGCVQGCHGCGNICPKGAITYVGDKTGWIPPKGEKANNSSTCVCKEKC